MVRWIVGLVSWFSLHGPTRVVSLLPSSTALRDDLWDEHSAATNHLLRSSASSDPLQSSPGTRRRLMKMKMSTRSSSGSSSFKMKSTMSSTSTHSTKKKKKQKSTTNKSMLPKSTSSKSTSKKKVMMMMMMTQKKKEKNSSTVASPTCADYFLCGKNEHGVASYNFKRIDEHGNCQSKCLAANNKDIFSKKSPWKCGVCNDACSPLGGAFKEPFCAGLGKNIQVVECGPTQVVVKGPDGGNFSPGELLIRASTAVGDCLDCDPLFRKIESVAYNESDVSYTLSTSFDTFRDIFILSETIDSIYGIDEIIDDEIEPGILCEDDGAHRRWLEDPMHSGLENESTPMNDESDRRLQQFPDDCSDWVDRRCDGSCVYSNCPDGTDCFYCDGNGPRQCFNGCGAGFLKTDGNFPFGSFAEACCIHDHCYDSHVFSKQTCESEFLKDMNQVCEDIPVFTFQRLLCRATAVALYGISRYFGFVALSFARYREENYEENGCDPLTQMPVMALTRAPTSTPTRAPTLSPTPDCPEEQKCQGDCLIPNDRCCSDGTKSIPGTNGECPCGLVDGNYCIDDKATCYKDVLGLGKCCSEEETRCGNGDCYDPDLKDCCLEHPGDPGNGIIAVDDVLVDKGEPCPSESPTTAPSPTPTRAPSQAPTPEETTAPTPEETPAPTSLTTPAPTPTPLQCGGETCPEGYNCVWDYCEEPPYEFYCGSTRVCCPPSKTACGNICCGCSAGC